MILVATWVQGASGEIPFAAAAAGGSNIQSQGGDNLLWGDSAQAKVLAVEWVWLARPGEWSQKEWVWLKEEGAWLKVWLQ